MKSKLKRERVIIVILSLIIIFFPTLQIKTEEELVKTINCNIILKPAERKTYTWLDMQDETKIMIDIHSSQWIIIEIKHGVDMVYFHYGNVHAFTETRTDESYLITIYQIGLNSAQMQGSIKAYHVYEVQEWLPWWMHNLNIPLP